VPVKEAGTKTNAAKRKQKQRETEEKHKQRLAELIGYAKHDGNTQKRGRTVLKSTDVIEAVIHKVRIERSFLRHSLTWQQELQAQSCQRMTRDALLKSEVLGTMLVRASDFSVVESSKAMELFCSFAPMRGYVGQGMHMMVHTDDAAAFVSTLRRASERSVPQATRVRLLRICIDPQSGCLFIRFVSKDVTIVHVGTDRQSLLLQCSMTHRDTAPMVASQAFWQAFWQTARANATGEFRTVTTFSSAPIFSWMASTWTGGAEVLDEEGDTAASSIWKKSCLGLAEVMGDMYVSASRYIRAVDSAPHSGLPMFLQAHQMFDELPQSDWAESQSQLLIPNGEPVRLDSMELTMYIAIGLPGEGENFEAVRYFVMVMPGASTPRVHAVYGWRFTTKSESFTTGHLGTANGGVHASQCFEQPVGPNPGAVEVLRQQGAELNRTNRIVLPWVFRHVLASFSQQRAHIS